MPRDEEDSLVAPPSESLAASESYRELEEFEDDDLEGEPEPWMLFEAFVSSPAEDHEGTSRAAAIKRKACLRGVMRLGIEWREASAIRIPWGRVLGFYCRPSHSTAKR